MLRSLALSAVRALTLATAFVLVANAQAQAQESEPALNNLGDSQADLVYTPVTPCRIIDTRLAGGALQPGVPRSFKVTGDTTVQGGASCGIPFGLATSAMINFVAVSPAGRGNLQITPFGQAMPLASFINYSNTAGTALANGLAVALCNPSAATCAKDVTIQANVSAVDLVADVQGYFRKTPALLVNTALANTALGAGALVANTTGHDNTATGRDTLASNTTGSYNTATGRGALAFNTSGDLNSAVGHGALYANTTGNYNSAFGGYALFGNTTGIYNSAFGAGALYANTTGNYNSAFGHGALSTNTVGVSNSAVGDRALYSNTTGNSNAAFGYALVANTTGNYNSAFGVQALAANTTGSENSAFGYALVANTTGSDNSAFGGSALASNTIGNYNSALGYHALLALSSGSYNTGIGYYAGGLLTSGDRNVYIHNYGVASESNTLRIGGTDIYNTYIAGISGATSASGVAVYVNSDGKLGTATSSRRYKEQMADMDAESDVLLKLRPVAFYYRPDLDETHLRQYGLVAEEVAEVAPGLVAYDEDGAPQTVRYHFVNAMLLNEVQKQRRQLEAQDAEIRDLRVQQAKFQALEARLAKLEAARGDQ